VVIALAIALVAVLVPALAFGHIERASYWPDPAPDTSVKPAAGGAVPPVRKLYSALKKKPPGTTRVVCEQPLRKGAASQASSKKLAKSASMRALNADIKTARSTGYKLRESQPAIRISKKKARKLRKFNVKLLRHCRYSSIQDAVTASHNNDRVEIMPGLYTEPKSRAQPTNDPACAQYKITNDKSQAGAVSYAYQWHCPNDQNLIAVLGRQLTNIPVPQPPRIDRHGIPDAGACIRCNLQIQGTGASPDAVTIDAGNVSSGDGAPIGSVKDVGIRADRADGFVLDNVKVRHAKEHDVYAIETDGSHLDHLKVPYAGEYGVLTFVADHSLIENCDAWGSGDSGLYPGAAADLGEAVPPDQRRYGTEIRDCDMHHNLLGYSGTDGNSVWIHDNNFYDNTGGFSTDVFTAPGHPGFPQDSDLLEHNNFYDNNFNAYLPPCAPGQKPGPSVPGQSPSSPGGNCSDVTPAEPIPVGLGAWIAGGNANVLRDNRFWNNWRRGVMLFAVPDAFVCNDPGDQVAGCNPVTPSGPSTSATSYRNKFFDNKMGQAPDGSPSPNGVDFWWDQGGVIKDTDPGYTSGNCWYDNTGSDGTAASVTGVPSPTGTPPDNLPSSCENSPLPGSAPPGGHGQVSELLACTEIGGAGCPWFTTPAKP
jgi:hypothetical protein